MAFLYNTSVTAKHQFDTLFLFNCTQYNITIPDDYVFYTVNGLQNFPNEEGDVLQIQNLSDIICHPSTSPLFVVQEGQIYQEKQEEFILLARILWPPLFTYFILKKQ